MKRRLRKKLHRRYLFDVVADVSQLPHWRRRLFAAVDAVCEIDALHCDHLPASLARTIRRHRLSYSVRVANSAEAVEWRDEATAGWVIFRFGAREFPEVHASSANNPAV
jgi:hypothetical protein